jgi:hypothetical protein
MEQRSICLFLAMKGLSARAIHNELTDVLGADAIAYSTVTLHLRRRLFPTILVDPPDDSPTTIVDQAIRDTLETQPFSSIRELAKPTRIPTTTVYRHLTQSLGFVVKHLRWVPHSLTDDQKGERVALSKQLLRELCSIKRHGWQFIITLDESWFYLATDHEQIWLRSEEQPPERPRYTIQDPKMMLTIGWNPLGFHVLNSLPKGRTLRPSTIAIIFSQHSFRSAHRSMAEDS